MLLTNPVRAFALGIARQVRNKANMFRLALNLCGVRLVWLVLLLLLDTAASARAQGFVSVSDMTQPRATHAATLLLDGRVLIVGGDGPAAPQSAEIYDPIARTFALTGGMAVARQTRAHTATRLCDGTVLVIGGSFSDRLAEIFDPSTGTFSLTVGPPNFTRLWHTATLLDDCSVLIAGGITIEEGFAASTAELYFPATGQFAIAGVMSVPHRGHSAAKLPDGSVLVVGGFVDPYNPVPPDGASTVAEVYRPGIGFSLTGGMAVPRTYFQATALADGRVLVTGGDDAYSGPVTDTAEIYDPVDGTFTTTGTMSVPRNGHQAVLLNSGLVLVVGGITAGGAADLYDPASGHFSSTGSMHGTRQDSQATKLMDGTVLVSGGADGGVNLSSAELYYEALLPNTVVGTEVTVTLNSGVTTTFDTVTAPGRTSVTTTASAPALPIGFTLDGSNYFDVTTTATFSGGVTICFTYGTSVADPTALLLLHYENGAWADVTTSNTIATRQLCGRVTSFSPFAVALPIASAAIQAPVNADGTSVFKAKRGVVPVKFTLTVGGVSTCQLPTAKISLFRTDGPASEQVNEAEYLLAADSGSTFRVSGCQYMYNLNASSLGAATYSVRIAIGSSVVGAGIFRLR